MEKVKKSKGIDLIEKIYESYYPYEAFIFLYMTFIFVLLLIASAPGLFATDDVAYMLMAKSLADDNTLEVSNGYDELNSTQLIPRHHSSHDGKLYGAYPQLYPFLAYPFYKFLGYYGLFFLNIASYLATLWILYKLSLLLFKDNCGKFKDNNKGKVDAKLMASFIVVTYSLFTYSIGYAVELRPHALAFFLVLLSVFLVFREYDKYSKEEGCEGGSDSLFALFVSGVISGLAIGVRYQSALFSGILMAFIVIIMGWRKFPLKFLSFVSGLAIPVGAILMINFYRYGNIFSSSYGDSALESFFYYKNFLLFAVILTLGVVVYVAYRLFYRYMPELAEFMPGFLSGFEVNTEGNRKVFAIILSSVMVFSVSFILFVLFSTSGLIGMDVATRIGNSARILYAEVVDMGAFPGSGVDDIKKALLQSDPIFVLAVFAPILMYKNRIKKEFILLLVALSIIEPLAFSAGVQFHGGGGYNMRYFLEALPFLTILASYSIVNMIRIEEFKRKEIILSLMLFLTGICTIIIISLGSSLNFNPETLNRISLGIAGVLLIVSSCYLLYYLLLSQKKRFNGDKSMKLNEDKSTITEDKSMKLTLIRSILIFFLVIGYSHCFILTLNDFGASWGARESGNRITTDVQRHIVDNSVIVHYNGLDVLWLVPLKTEKTVRVAYAEYAELNDTMELVDFYTKKDIQIYIVGNVSGGGLNFSMVVENVSSNEGDVSMVVEKVGSNDGDVSMVVGDVEDKRHDYQKDIEFIRGNILPRYEYEIIKTNRTMLFKIKDEIQHQ